MSQLFSHAETVPQELRAHMARRSIRQGDLAQRLGKSNNWVGRRLSGRYQINLDQLDSIAGALGLEVRISITEPKGKMR